MPRRLRVAEYDALLRADLAGFTHRAFRTLYPRSLFQMSWHIEVVAARLAAVSDGRIRRLLINLPPCHLKSLLASVALPAWVLGHDPGAEILCGSYARDLADKWSRDCRRIMASTWYRWLFPTRLAPAKQAMAEFETTTHGCRIATSVGGVLTGRGADLIVIDDPLRAPPSPSRSIHWSGVVKLLPPRGRPRGLPDRPFSKRVCTGGLPLPTVKSIFSTVALGRCVRMLLITKVIRAC